MDFLDHIFLEQLLTPYFQKNGPIAWQHHLFGPSQLIKVQYFYRHFSFQSWLPTDMSAPNPNQQVHPTNHSMP
ncbi:hypothetical protein D8B35_04450 [Lactococcus laudensis]|nr:hypothetical protein [Lactococcus laudensis]